MALANHYFDVKLNLAASAQQPEIIQQLKTNGDDVIQTSSGLCVKSSMSEDELREFISTKVSATGVSISEIDTSKAEDLGELSKDVRSFIGLS